MMNDFSRASQSSYMLEIAQLGFSENVYCRKKALNLSDAELAEKVGTSTSYISRVFHGNVNVSLKMMVAIAHALGCHLYPTLKKKC